MKFDLLIKNGTVIDPAGRSGRLDVAIKRDRIAAVDTNIPEEAAFRVIDATGQYVTPGLIDMHTHIYEGATFWGIQPDPIAARSGTTTWLDVGTAGAYNWPGFREYIVKKSDVRIYSLLNLSAIGLTAPTGEFANLDYCDIDLASKIIDENRDIIVGIKARIDRNTVRANGMEPLSRARQLADRCELPIMVHIGSGPPAVGEVLSYLKEGDMLTHCFTGQDMRLIDNAGLILDVAKQAIDRGILLDVGHGGGSFSYEVAEALFSAGYRPHMISSDIHQFSVDGPMFDMPTCLSKFLGLGMSLEEVIEASTATPAKALGVPDIGNLKPGSWADVALFSLKEGTFPLYDIHMVRRDVSQFLYSNTTIINGRVLPQKGENPRAPWANPTKDQIALVERGHTPADYRKA
jgi:dihydroorotase